MFLGRAGENLESAEGGVGVVAWDLEEMLCYFEFAWRILTLDYGQ